MNICNDNHDDIAFESRNCPLCELRSQYTEDIDTLHSIHSLLQSQLENLEETYSELVSNVKSHAPELLI